MLKMCWQDIQVWAIRCWKSRTMMFNLAVAVFASLEGTYSVLQPFVPGNAYAYLTVLLTVGNAALRVKTTQALKDK